MRRLIAEDDATIADALLRSLRLAGYAVDSVKDGEEADSALVAGQFDLLILAPGLPKLTAPEVLRVRGAKLPVLILTARDDVSDRVRGLDLGADDYLATISPGGAVINFTHVRYA